jgi:hypothetical protein
VDQISNDQSSINIFPNPAANQLTIYTGIFFEHSIRIFDAKGIVRFETSAIDPDTTVSLHTLSTGFYIVQILCPENNLSFSHKFIKL